MYRTQIEQVRRNTSNFEELAGKALEARKHDEAVAGLENRQPSFERLTDRPHASYYSTEAIILSELRPAYFVLETGLDLVNAVQGDPILTGLIEGNKRDLEAICNSVGRVDLVNHWTLPYGGTGFLIDEDLAVTNRHVAQLFAEALWNGYRFRRGRFGNEIEARLDYRQLHRSQQRKRAEVDEVLYIARDHEPDFALLRVRKLDDVAPLVLSADKVAPGAPVAVIGYPAEDGDRNEKELMDRLFGGVYQVKRFAPGFVTERDDNGVVLLADYTSLGGNSGSPVVGLDTGNVLGLHFAGRFMENNYAVSADVLDAARRQVRLVHAVAAVPEEAPVTAAADLADRNGYDADFLGSGELRVPLPGPGAWTEDEAPVAGTQDNVLRYRNFSTIQSASRRLPLVTAVNIDGAQAKALRRKGTWRLDGRLSADHQIGNDLYHSNPLDRGHLVRRRDPGWGDAAQEAEIDTFHYTNCAPQHEHLNQRDWLGLEDYILEAAETRGFRASVFTGPVFRSTDRRLRRQPGAADVQIPEEFWKIAVIVNEATGALSATGYVLSHGPFIRNLVESPFVYGSYRTYQVQIARIAAETGLHFGSLPEADPLGAVLDTEAPFSAVAREITGPESLILTSPHAPGALEAQEPS